MAVLPGVGHRSHLSMILTRVVGAINVLRVDTAIITAAGEVLWRARHDTVRLNYFVGQPVGRASAKSGPPSLDLNIPPLVPFQALFSQGPCRDSHSASIHNEGRAGSNLTSQPRCFRPCKGPSGKSFRHRAERNIPRSGSARRGGRRLPRKALRIAGSSAELGDLLAVAKSQMRPGLAGIGGFVNPVADREIGAVQSFAAADVNDIGIWTAHRDGADGAGGLIVEDRMPGTAGIGGLEDPAINRRHVKYVWLRRDAGDGTGPTSAEGSDISPMQGGIKVGGAGEVAERGEDEEGG